MQHHHSSDIRHVKLFINGRNQAVRIPRDFELVGDEALMRREGTRLIIEPISTQSLTELLRSWKPLKDGLPEISDSKPDPEDLW